MLDDNGYVIISDNLQETGIFFGRIRPDILKDLVDEKIYKVIRMYDYQGLCPEGQETTNVGNTFITVSEFLLLAHINRICTYTNTFTQPFPQLLPAINWIVNCLLVFFARFTFALFETCDEDVDHSFYHNTIEEHLKYAPCDLDTYIYEYNFSSLIYTDKSFKRFAQVFCIIISIMNIENWVVF